jgi:hypothetical protein
MCAATCFCASTDASMLCAADSCSCHRRQGHQACAPLIQLRNMQDVTDLLDSVQQLASSSEEAQALWETYRVEVWPSVARCLDAPGTALDAGTVESFTVRVGCDDALLRKLVKAVLAANGEAEAAGSEGEQRARLAARVRGFISANAFLQGA